jgi:NAD(P)-dependent dehydrogenase (short-subunit alcohol dehydrogenase family)
MPPSLPLEPLSLAVAAGLALFALHRVFVHERTTLPPSPDPKRILITGAASGIGLETAKLFKSRGWIVGLADIDLAACARAQADVGADASYQLDVVDADACVRVAKDFVTSFGQLDALFNSAGILVIGLFEEEPIVKQTRQVRINLEGVCNMTHAALHHMQPGARVVNMASGSAIAGIPNHAVYAATKAAIYSLTEALNMELSLRGISVADVSVMYVATPMVERQANKNTLILRRASWYIAPARVAETVWQAVHKARLHRVRAWPPAPRPDFRPLRAARNTSTWGSTCSWRSSSCTFAEPSGCAWARARCT